jgi:hypothetical protein
LLLETVHVFIGNFLSLSFIILLTLILGSSTLHCNTIDNLFQTMEHEQVNDREVLAQFGRQCLSRALSSSNGDVPPTLDSGEPKPASNGVVKAKEIVKVSWWAVNKVVLEGVSKLVSIQKEDKHLKQCLTSLCGWQAARVVWNTEAEEYCPHQARSADTEVDDEIDEVKLNSQLRFLCWNDEFDFVCLLSHSGCSVHRGSGVLRTPGEIGRCWSW